MEPAVHYSKTADGVRIAYTVLGEGPPMVCCAAITRHVQLDWSKPVVGPFLAEFARHNTLIRFENMLGDVC